MPPPVDHLVTLAVAAAQQTEEARRDDAEIAAEAAKAAKEAEIAEAAAKAKADLVQFLRDDAKITCEMERAAVMKVAGKIEDFEGYAGDDGKETFVRDLKDIGDVHIAAARKIVNKVWEKLPPQTQPDTGTRPTALTPQTPALALDDNDDDDTIDNDLYETADKDLYETEDNDDDDDDDDDDGNPRTPTPPTTTTGKGTTVTLTWNSTEQYEVKPKRNQTLYDVFTHKFTITSQFRPVVRRVVRMLLLQFFHRFVDPAVVWYRLPATVSSDFFADTYNGIKWCSNPSQYRLEGKLKFSYWPYRIFERINIIVDDFDYAPTRMFLSELKHLCDTLRTSGENIGLDQAHVVHFSKYFVPFNSKDVVGPEPDENGSVATQNPQDANPSPKKKMRI